MSAPKDPAETSSANLRADGFIPAGEVRWSKRRAVRQPVEEKLGAPLLKIEYTHVLQQLWTHPDPMRGMRWQNVPSVEFKVEDI